MKLYLKQKNLMKIQLMLCLILNIGIIRMTAQTQTNTKNDMIPINIVPQPTKLTAVSGSFTITNRTQIIVPNANEGIRRVAQQLADHIKIDGTSVSVIDLNNSKSNINVIFFLENRQRRLRY